MGKKRRRVTFSEVYAQVRALRSVVREEGEPVPESVLQSLWYHQHFRNDDLHSVEGHRIEVLSPGWWNKEGGPDFRNAQIRFNGTLVTGDVEIHYATADWHAHRHSEDPAYADVILHVVFDHEPGIPSAHVQGGKSVPTLVLKHYLLEDIHKTGERFSIEEQCSIEAPRPGKCAAVLTEKNAEPLVRFLQFAGEWRLLNKARNFEERMKYVGVDQAIYEGFMGACGYAHFKAQFQTIARFLPFERAQQLAAQDPFLLEAALFQLAGLLPSEDGARGDIPHHLQRLLTLQRRHLPTLRSLGMRWDRRGVRPQNTPERRLAAAALFITRLGSSGFWDTLYRLWHEPRTPLQYRRAFEQLFPKPVGYWATHTGWFQAPLPKPVALLSLEGRARSIIGNIFLPASLAVARMQRDRALEEKVYRTFVAMPAEPDNRIVRAMVPRLLMERGGVRLDFRLQQGLLQLHEDWCEHNPSCHNCLVLRYVSESVLYLTGLHPDARQDEHTP